MKIIGIDKTRLVWLATYKERERNEGWVKGVKRNWRKIKGWKVCSRDLGWTNQK
jgi:hypothetical protein